MPKVNLQFHGTTTEIEAWASGWAAEHNLCLVLERFFPQKRYVVVADGAIAEAAQKLDGAWDRMWLLREPVPSDPTTFAPLADGPECLAVTPGCMTEEGLRESSIGVVATNQDALQTWRKIIKSAKSNLQKGAWVLNPVSGARQRDENHYFTAGALAASRDGVKMLAAAGWNQFELGDDDG
jgi:hypothetical protein